MTQIYEKYRELDVNPEEVNFKDIKIKDIISYPPAQNDVIECICEYKNNNITTIIKFERSKMAEFDNEVNHLNKLKTLGLKNIPEVIEYGKYENKNYMVLSKLEGERLSDIFNTDISKEEKNKYLIEYGRTLASIHKIKMSETKEAKKRIINNYPLEENYKEIPTFLQKYIKYLKNNMPQFNNETFIHGDFHYANILWHNFKASGLLDWEYSGMGFKEQDIAWSCILRPTQRFMDNLEDIKYFLKGYEEIEKFNHKYFYWCLINGYCHFYLMNLKNDEYKKKLEKLIVEIYNKLDNMYI